MCCEQSFKYFLLLFKGALVGENGGTSNCKYFIIIIPVKQLIIFLKYDLMVKSITSEVPQRNFIT